MIARQFMSLVSLILLCAGLAPSCQPKRPRRNRIDILASNADVITFLHSLDSNLVFEPSKSQNQIQSSYWIRRRRCLDSFGTKLYEMADLDNNGLTDLIYNGPRSTTVVLAFPGDSFVVAPLPKEFNHGFFAAKTIHINGRVLLQTLTEVLAFEEKASKKGFPHLHDTTFWRMRSDTLDWSDGQPVERSPHPPQVVDTLRFYCKSGIEMTIIKDSIRLEKSCDYRPINALDSGGIFATMLDGRTAARLYDLLAKIDLMHLQKQYRKPGFDLPSCDFEFWFNHGIQKTVWDDGAEGTYGLVNLGNMLMGFLKTQTWKQITPGGPDYFFFRVHYGDPWN